jgi:hypothetical protein
MREKIEKRKKRKTAMQTPVADQPAPSRPRPHPHVPIREEIEEEHASSARSVPSHTWSGHWLSAREFATVVNRREQTVYKWIRLGVLAEFGIPTYMFRSGRPHSGRVFILNVY